jgi:hypothetical protein
VCECGCKYILLTRQVGFLLLLHHICSYYAAAELTSTYDLTFVFSYHTAATVAEPGAAPPPATPPPPGHSEKSLKRVLGESPLTPENLEKAKLGIVGFLSSEILPEAEVACHYIIASSDTRHRYFLRWWLDPDLIS